MSSRKAQNHTVTALSFAGMLLGSLTMVVPFLWMLSTALKDSKSVFRYPPQWIPNPAQWHNFVDVWHKMPLAHDLLNSLIVSAVIVVVGLFTTTMAAFAFAKLDIPHKNIWFMLVLVIMMFPAVVVIIPQFLMYTAIGWINTLLPLMVPGALGNAAMVFFLRQYMIGLPSELMDAARLDGASVPRIYWSVFLPLCRPAIAAYAIIVFMTAWNMYLEPLVFTNSPQLETVQKGIAALMSSGPTSPQPDMTIVMTASLIAILPVIIVFLFLQKYFIDSFAISGFKG